MASLKSYISTCLSSFFNSKSDWIKKQSLPTKLYSTVTLQQIDDGWIVTAPCNGYCCLQVWNIVYSFVANKTYNLYSGELWTYSRTSGDDMRNIVPCQKGDTILISYKRLSGASAAGNLVFVQTSE